MDRIFTFIGMGIGCVVYDVIRHGAVNGTTFEYIFFIGLGIVACWLTDK